MSDAITRLVPGGDANRHNSPPTHAREELWKTDVTTRHPSPDRSRDFAPCLDADGTKRFCLSGFLHGVRCCPDQSCALCVATRERMLSRGFAPIRVNSMMAGTRRNLADACPLCGFPPPPPLAEIPPLPRLDRSDNPLTGCSACQICEKPLKPPQRKFCGNECWLEHRRRTEGWGQGGDRRNERHPREARFVAE